MKRSVDATALVTGLVALLIALVGLWAAFGSVPWPTLGALVPLLLVAFGLIGLFASRSRP